MSTKEETVRIDGRELKITHSEKILFPDDGLRKRDLIDYYRRIAPWILPHLRGRPLAMERYPDGIDRPGFFHKSAPSYYPGWIETVTVEKKQGGTVRHVVCNNVATLAYLANQACVTPHIWLSRVDNLDYPDQMVFDLDPAAEIFELVKATAQSLKEVLDQLNLPAYLKTTGSRGLHVAVPLKRREHFESGIGYDRGAPRAPAAHAGATQGHAPRPHLSRHESQRLWSDGGARLCGARPARRSSIRPASLA
jgi:bifunctional non-homologous end joining protein LigD